MPEEQIDFEPAKGHIIFMAPDEDGDIEIGSYGTAYLSEEDSIHLRDWLLKLYPL